MNFKMRDYFKATYNFRLDSLEREVMKPIERSILRFFARFAPLTLPIECLVKSGERKVKTKIGADTYKENEIPRLKAIMENYRKRS